MPKKNKKTKIVPMDKHYDENLKNWLKSLPKRERAIQTEIADKNLQRIVAHRTK